jgi:hypothetical protein
MQGMMFKQTSITPLYRSCSWILWALFATRWGLLKSPLGPRQGPELNDRRIVSRVYDSLANRNQCHRQLDRRQDCDAFDQREGTDRQSPTSGKAQL